MSGLPQVRWNYCFLSSKHDKDENHKLTVMVCKEHNTKNVGAAVVPRKGAQEINWSSKAAHPCLFASAAKKHSIVA